METFLLGFTTLEAQHEKGPDGGARAKVRRRGGFLESFYDTFVFWASGATGLGRQEVM